MSPVKFVHILKKIENLERDISEIMTLQSEVKQDRSYATPLKISLEQAVNNLLNEKVKLMEVRIENPPANIASTINSDKTQELKLTPRMTFDEFEEDYFTFVNRKRTYGIAENSSDVSAGAELQKEARKTLPSLAEKTLVKETRTLPETAKVAPKRADLLKDLPPLEY